MFFWFATIRILDVGLNELKEKNNFTLDIPYLSMIVSKSLWDINKICSTEGRLKILTAHPKNKQ